jgi:hypothetical protein
VRPEILNTSLQRKAWHRTLIPFTHLCHKTDQLAKMRTIFYRIRLQFPYPLYTLKVIPLLQKLIPVGLWITLNEVLQLGQIRCEECAPVRVSTSHCTLMFCAIGISFESMDWLGGGRVESAIF